MERPFFICRVLKPQIQPAEWACAGARLTRANRSPQRFVSCACFLFWTWTGIPPRPPPRTLNVICNNTASGAQHAHSFRDKEAQEASTK